MIPRSIEDAAERLRRALVLLQRNVELLGGDVPEFDQDLAELFRLRLTVVIRAPSGVRSG